MTGGEFKALRVGAGVSRAQVAGALGVAVVTVYRWETGRRLGDRSAAGRGGLPSGAVDWLRAEVARRCGAPGGLSG